MRQVKGKSTFFECCLVIRRIDEDSGKIVVSS